MRVASLLKLLRIVQMASNFRLLQQERVRMVEIVVQVVTAVLGEWRLWVVIRLTLVKNPMKNNLVLP